MWFDKCFTYILYDSFLSCRYFEFFRILYRRFATHFSYGKLLFIHNKIIGKNLTPRSTLLPCRQPLIFDSFILFSILYQKRKAAIIISLSYHVKHNVKLRRQKRRRISLQSRHYRWLQSYSHATLATSSIVVEFQMHRLEIDSNEVKAQDWDTAGQQRLLVLSREGLLVLI